MLKEPGKIEILERSPEVLHLKEGEALSFFAEFTVHPSGRDNYTAQWSHVYNRTSGIGNVIEDIVDDEHHKFSQNTVNNGYFTEKLMIGGAAVTTNKSGTYVLTVSHTDTVQEVRWTVEIENEEPDVEMVIRQPPHFFMLNQAFFMPGTLLDIECVSLSIPQANVQLETRTTKYSNFTAINGTQLKKIVGTFENRYIWNANVFNNIDVQCSSTKYGKVRRTASSILIAEKPVVRLQKETVDRWTRTEDSEILYDGDDVLLECIVPHVRNWSIFVVHKEQKLKHEFVIKNQSKHILLNMRNVSSTASGKYTCVMQNGGYEERLDANITIIKTVKPYIISEQESDITVDYDKVFELSCGITGIPTPEYNWLMDGKPVEHGEIEGSLLKVFRARPEDKGSYECEAINRAGSAKNKFRVEVNKIPKKRWFRLSNKLILLFSLSLSIVVCFFVVSSELRKRSVEKIKSLPSFDEEARDIHSTTTEHTTLLMSELSVESPVDDVFDILRENLHIEETLGSGKFGTVHRGFLTMRNSTSDSNYSLPVAVKRAENQFSMIQQEMLADELRIMRYFKRHPNVIALVGAVMERREQFIVLEYMDRGNLLSYLKKYRFSSSEGSVIEPVINGDYLNDMRLKPVDLISFGMQIAFGMVYLASLPCVHRDLAARNILINSKKVIRIADFGLARRPTDKDYYKAVTCKEKYIPLLWMAPESIRKDKLFTQKSDVWSFGICLYEIYTLGKKPYHNVRGQSVESYILDKGINEQPDHCPDQIYLLMKNCWEWEADDRPKFEECFVYLRNYLNSVSSQYLENLDKDLLEEEKQQKLLDNWI